jgi:hypothetical protein
MRRNGMLPFAGQGDRSGKDVNANSDASDNRTWPVNAPGPVRRMPVSAPELSGWSTRCFDLRHMEADRGAAGLYKTLVFRPLWPFACGMLRSLLAFDAPRLDKTGKSFEYAEGLPWLRRERQKASSSR